MATEREIQYRLWQWRNRAGHGLIVPNCQIYGYDADLLSVTRGGLVHEYEIKCSVADFRAERRAADTEADIKTWHRHPKWRKHHRLQNGKPDRRGPGRPNYFSYVYPALLNIESYEVPEYAGIIYYMEHERGISTRFEVIREAPRLHDLPVSVHQRAKIATSLEYRFWNAVASQVT